MEPLNLLFSILSTFFTSLILSLLLPFRTLLRLLLFSRAATDAAESVSLYEGAVWHERRRPVHHSFKYPIRYALIDLDRAPHPPRDHLSADEARRIADTSGPVFLLTIPPSVGYEQNPLSLYYCYDIEGSLQHLNKCIAEVTNTPWGERVSFVFDPISDTVAKPLHVSPFMDMAGNWNIRANSPGDNLHVTISVGHPKLGDYFIATLKAKRVSSSCTSDHAIFFYLMPQKVAIWIYWHAFKLWWKNVQFLRHPRYTNPAYREDAVSRDQMLQCCKAFGPDKDKDLKIEGTGRVDLADRNSHAHQFTWRNAKWPWA